MNESTPNSPNFEPTPENIAEKITRVMQALQSIREVAADASFVRTRALLREKEPEIDIKAVQQLLGEAMQTFDGLVASEAPIRKETFEGFAARQQRLEEVLAASREFFEKRLPEAVSEDTRIRVSGAYAANDYATVEDMFEKSRGVRMQGLAAQLGVIELLAVSYHISSRLDLMQNLQEQAGQTPAEQRRQGPSGGRG